MDGRVVRIFLMGANRWLEADPWLPPGLPYQPVYLREGSGQTAASLNNGMLTFDLPREDEPAENFLYDPVDPVESLLIYPLLGPKDHRPVERRILTYTSSPLASDLTVAGPAQAVFYGTASAPDTDWVVPLFDVWHNGP